MASYGPINRFWFDGGPANPPDDPAARPLGTNGSDILHNTLALIREMSPLTLISPSHGDICATTETLYTQSAPRPNSSDPTGCAAADESGEYFHPTEMHGITMQQGPDVRMRQLLGPFRARFSAHVPPRTRDVTCTTSWPILSDAAWAPLLYICILLFN